MATLRKQRRRGPAAGVQADSEPQPHLPHHHHHHLPHHHHHHGGDDLEHEVTPEAREAAAQHEEQHGHSGDDARRRRSGKQPARRNGDSHGHGDDGDDDDANNIIGSPTDVVSKAVHSLSPGHMAAHEQGEAPGNVDREQKKEARAQDEGPTHPSQLNKPHSLNLSMSGGTSISLQHMPPPPPPPSHFPPPPAPGGDSHHHPHHHDHNHHHHHPHRHHSHHHPHEHHGIGGSQTHDGDETGAGIARVNAPGHIPTAEHVGGEAGALTVSSTARNTAPPVPLPTSTATATPNTDNKGTAAAHEPGSGGSAGGDSSRSSDGARGHTRASQSKRKTGDADADASKRHKHREQGSSGTAENHDAQARLELEQQHHLHPHHSHHDRHEQQHQQHPQPLLAHQQHPGHPHAISAAGVLAPLDDRTIDVAPQHTPLPHHQHQHQHQHHHPQHAPPEQLPPQFPHQLQQVAGGSALGDLPLSTATSASNPALSHAVAPGMGPTPVSSSVHVMTGLVPMGASGANTATAPAHPQATTASASMLLGSQLPQSTRVSGLHGPGPGEVAAHHGSVYGVPYSEAQQYAGETQHLPFHAQPLHQQEQHQHLQHLQVPQQQPPQQQQQQHQPRTSTRRSAASSRRRPTQSSVSWSEEMTHDMLALLRGNEYLLATGKTDATSNQRKREGWESIREALLRRYPHTATWLTQAHVREKFKKLKQTYTKHEQGYRENHRSFLSSRTRSTPASGAGGSGSGNGGGGAGAAGVGVTVAGSAAGVAGGAGARPWPFFDAMAGLLAGRTGTSSSTVVVAQETGEVTTHTDTHLAQWEEAEATHTTHHTGIAGVSVFPPHARRGARRPSASALITNASAASTTSGDGGAGATRSDMAISSGSNDTNIGLQRRQHSGQSVYDRRVEGGTLLGVYDATLQQQQQQQQRREEAEEDAVLQRLVKATEDAVSQQTAFHQELMQRLSAQAEETRQFLGRILRAVAPGEADDMQRTGERQGEQDRGDVDEAAEEKQQQPK